MSNTGFVNGSGDTKNALVVIFLRGGADGLNMVVPVDDDAYYASRPLVGISKSARVVEIFATRLQTQETMTSQIAQAIEETLKPRGVAVLIDAEHQCMSTRGVHHKDVTTVTTQFTGAFKDDAEMRNRFLKLAGYG